MAVRTMAVWCPDWPVVAAIRTGSASAADPVAVLRANRVIAASASARADGVRRAMRRREAQSRCPDVVVVDDDPGRDARAFEPVAAAVDAFTPRIEIVRPGLCQFPTLGPSRYFGGDEALAAKVRDALIAIGVEARLGVADGPFAAALAARSPVRSRDGFTPGGENASLGVSFAPGGENAPLIVTGTPGVVIVAAGATAAFLADHPIDALVAVEGGRAVTQAARSTRRASSSDASDSDALALVDLVDLLRRLGIRTLGAFAALPKGDVLARFGPVGERAWRLSAGLEVRAPSTRKPPPDLIVQTELDPPVERIDTAAFVAKGLAEELHDRLAANGLACTRISIEAKTAHGEHLARLWRHERAGAAGGLTAAGLADRVRWQLNGWLQSADSDQIAEREARTTGGIVLLRLVPDEVEPDVGRQLGLWGGASAADERAARAFARVQGLLGPDAVTTVVPSGGRRPLDFVARVSWGDQRTAPSDASHPWPGRIPEPWPTVVHPLPLPAQVVDARGTPVGVSGRGETTAVPSRVAVARSPLQTADRWADVVAWAGPWPLDERWWDVHAHHRQARMQLVTATGEAHLAVLEGGAWWIEASYA